MSDLRERELARAAAAGDQDAADRLKVAQQRACPAHRWRYVAAWPPPGPHRLCRECDLMEPTTMTEVIANSANMGLPSTLFRREYEIKLRFGQGSGGQAEARGREVTALSPLVD